jgi:hypothetical protein
VAQPEFLSSKTSFTPHGSKIYCAACGDTYLNHKGNLLAHLATSEHKSKIARYLNRVTESGRNFPKSRIEHYAQARGDSNLGRKTDPAKHHFRGLVARAFVHGYLPPHKLESKHLLDLIQDNAIRRFNVSPSHLAQMYFPGLLVKERNGVAAEIQHSLVGVVFDFATYMDAEYFAVLVNFVRVTDTGGLRRGFRLLRLSQFGTSCQSETIAGLTVETLRMYGVASTSLVSITHDTASVNQAASGGLMAIWPQMDPCNCMSHFVNKVGEYFTDNLSTLDELLSSWCSLMNSKHAKHAHRSVFGVSPESWSDTRWFGKQQCITGLARRMKPVLLDLLPLLEEEDISPKTLAKFSRILRTESVILALELALAFDVGQILAKTCYLLESDEFILPVAFSWIDNMVNLLRAAVVGKVGIPTVISVAEALFPGQPREQQRAIDSTVDKAKPALLYAEKRLLNKSSEETKSMFPRLTGDCVRSYSILRAARLVDPLFVRELKLETINSSLDDLKSLNHFRTKQGMEDLKYLKSEFPQYLSHAQSATDTVSFQKFWSKRSKLNQIPAWVRLVKLLMAHNSSSAGPERAFSQLRLAKTHLQASQLESTTELLVLTKVNETLREAEENQGLKRPPPIPTSDPLCTLQAAAEELEAPQDDASSVVAFAHELLQLDMVYELEPGEPIAVADNKIEQKDELEAKQDLEQPAANILFVDVFSGALSQLESDLPEITTALIGRTVLYKFNDDWGRAVITKFYPRGRTRNKYNVECRYEDGSLVDQRLVLGHYIHPLPASKPAFDTLLVSSWILVK